MLAGGAEVAVPLEGLIDFEQERQRLAKRNRRNYNRNLRKVQGQLSNPQFVERAPAEKVAELRARVEDIAQRVSQMDQIHSEPGLTG